MARRFAFLAALAVAAAAGVGAGAAAASPSGASASRAPFQAGIVDVETNLAYQDGAAAGTGMVLTASGEVLTNNHVIRGATSIRVRDPQTGRTYPARVLGYSTSTDVALIKLQGASHLPAVSLGDSSKVRVGQRVIAIGNAGGTGTLTTAAGEVTGLGRTITASDEQGRAHRLTGLIETSASLQPGDSGGPLLNAAGKVIGMNSAAAAGFLVQPARNQSYAVPINRAVSIASQIATGRASATVHIGATAFLGVQLRASDSGELITAVVPGSPADKAGLAAGDVLTASDGQALDSPATLPALMQRKQPGSTVKLTWVDQLGNQRSTTVALASGPPQ